MWGILTVIAQCLGENHWHQLWGRARTFTTEKSPTVFTNTQESRHQSLITFDGLNAFWDLHLWQNRRAMWASLPTSIVTLWCQGFWYFRTWKSLGHSVSWRDKLHCGRTDIFWIGVVTNLYVSEAFFTHPVFQGLRPGGPGRIGFIFRDRWAYFADGWRNHQLNHVLPTKPPNKATPPKLRGVSGGNPSCSAAPSQSSPHQNQEVNIYSWQPPFAP